MTNAKHDLCYDTKILAGAFCVVEKDFNHVTKSQDYFNTIHKHSLYHRVGQSEEPQGYGSLM